MTWAPGFRTAAYWATLIAFLAAYIWVHVLADYVFPVPWPDEGSFLWQAIAVQEHNTLFAPQLNPDRHVMWMPPGYMILQGLLFKVMGFSLAGARAFSAVYVMAGTVILATMLRRYRYPYLYLLLCGWFLLSRDFVFTGNLARMEGLVFLMAATGFALLQRDRYYAGLALVSLTPLVHPNGLYISAGAAAYGLIMLWKHPDRRRPGAIDVVLTLLSAALWGAYLLYVALHWEHFLSDMEFQMTWRYAFSIDTTGPWHRLASREMLILGALSMTALAYGVRRETAATFLLSLAIPLGVLSLTTIGEMYAIYVSLAMLLASVVLVELAMQLAADLVPDASTAWWAPLAAAVILVAALLNLRAKKLESPFGYPYRMDFGGTFGGMRTASTTPYYGEKDIEVLGLFIRSLGSPGSPVTVQFFPAGDALLFHDLQGKTVRFSQPTFFTEKPDVCIMHVSRHHPGSLQHFMRLQIAFQAGIPLESPGWQILRQRDGTERWVVHAAGVAGRLR